MAVSSALLQLSVSTARRRNLVVKVARVYRARHTNLTVFIREGEGERAHATPSHYQRRLLGSKFTLCPGGHNPETYRMFEALEAG